MERGFFAPPVHLVALSVGRAFVRPLMLCGIYVGAIIMTEASSSAWLPFGEDLYGEGPGAGGDRIAVAQPGVPERPAEDTSITELAFALARDQIQTASLPVAETVVAPFVPPPEVPHAAVAAVHHTQVASLVAIPAAVSPVQAPPPAPVKAVDPKLISDISDQQSLIKFISGLIAAFRPSIQDCGTIARYIVETSMQEKVDPLFVAAVIAIESRFHSGAESGAGAQGLMQIMPDTARHLVKRGMAHRNAPSKLMDPRTNIKLGIEYLKFLERRYRGNRFLALAAYNWGPGNVDTSRKSGGRIPGSVRDYSNTIISRADRWRKHFTKAAESAALLEKNRLAQQEAAQVAPVF